MPLRRAGHAVRALHVGWAATAAAGRLHPPRSDQLSDRLPWKLGERPKQFIARMPEGMAEIWWRPSGAPGPEGWWFRVGAGETVTSYSAGSKQDAADKATEAWYQVVRQERARVTKIDATRHLEARISAAHAAGSVDVMAFGLGSSEYRRLLDINDFLRQQGWLEGALKPLAAAVSAELFRRRTAR